jgi:hypothetical protein
LSPQTYLFLLLIILLGMLLAGGLAQFRRRRKLRACAKRWNMHFAAGDRLRLARRIVSQFPVPGAANIGVRDLLFRTGDNQHHYVFTVDYTVGVIRGKIGKSRVAGFSEPVARRGRADAQQPTLVLAPANLSGAAAYEHLLKSLHFSPA